MIMIYQMTKVASRSWVEVAKSCVPGGGPAPLHCHYIVPRNRARIQAAFDLPVDRQTIANMLLPRNMLRVGAAVWDAVAEARDRRERIRVITGMRDPVARSISLIMFVADFYGQAGGPLMPGHAMSPADVIGTLQESWRMVLNGEEPRQTFEWLLWFLNQAFRSWFHDELAVSFGADVLQAAVAGPDAAPSLQTASADILFYRVEDMAPGAPGYGRLLEQASAFLGTQLTGFPAVNTGATRRSHALSDAVRRQFRLPAAMLDAIYDEPVVRHIYSRDEIAAFRRRWSASPTEDEG